MTKEDLMHLVPGKILRQTRENKQITPSDVAARLLISKQIVGDLENNDYSRIPAKVYAEGYLKAYAKFLQLPVDEVISQFRALDYYQDEEIGAKPKAELKTNSKNVFKDRYFNEAVSWTKKIAQKKVLVGFGMLLIVLISAFLYFSPFNNGKLNSVVSNDSYDKKILKNNEIKGEIKEDGRVYISLDDQVEPTNN